MHEIGISSRSPLAGKASLTERRRPADLMQVEAKPLDNTHTRMSSRPDPERLLLFAAPGTG